MTFWQWVIDNRTKLLGSFTLVLSTMVTMAASGTFEGLLSPESIRWLGIIGMLVGVATGGVGFSNSTQEKVAESKAAVAQSMQVAIEATPPQAGPHRV